MKRLLWIVFAVALVAPIVAQQPSAAELFNRGLLLERAEGRAKDAIGFYERVLRDFPSDQEIAPQAMYRLALAYQATNDARAMATFERLANEFPSSRFADEARQRVGQSQALPFKVSDSSELLKDVLGTPYFSDDGRLAAYVAIADRAGVFVKDLTTGRGRRLGDAPSGAPTMRFSPDGKQLVTLWGGRGSARNPPDMNLRAFDVNGGRQTSTPLAPLVFDGAIPAINQMPWSPDGEWLPHVAPTADPKIGEIKLWSPHTGQLRSLGIQADAHTPFRWSPDGKRLALRVQQASKNIDEVRVVTVATGESRTIASGGFRPNGRWTSHDQLILTRANPGPPSTVDLFIVPAAGGTPKNICTQTPGADGDSCSVTPDGRYSLRRSGAEKHYFIREIPDGKELPLTRGSGEELGLMYSVDGKLVAFYSNRDGRWAEYVATLDRLPITEPVRIAVLDTPPMGVLSPISEFRDRLALRSIVNEGNVAKMELDPRTGKAAPGAAFDRLTQDAEYNDQPTVSPDGKLIAYRWRTARKGGIAVMDASGANERHLLELPQPNSGALFWRSNDEILFSRGFSTATGSELSVLNVKTGAMSPVRRVSINPEYVRGTDEVLGAPDGPGVTNPNVFRIVSLATGAERELKTGALADDSIDLWYVSPNGKQVAYTVLRKDSTELRVMNLDGTGDRALIPMHEGQVGIAAWSGDARFLLYDPDYNGDKARLINVATGENWPLVEPFPSWDTEGSFAPDNSFVVVTTSESRAVWQTISGITYDAVAKLMKK